MTEQDPWYETVSKLIDENADLREQVKDMTATIGVLRAIVTDLRQANTTQPYGPRKLHVYRPDVIEYRSE